MTQQVVRARVSIPNSGSLEDQTSFDVYLEATGSNTNLDFGTSETPFDAIATFLNVVGTGGANPLSTYMSNDLSRTANAVKIDWTDITAHLDGSPAGTPFRTDTFTLGAAGGATNPLPAQLAVCVGYRRAYGTDLEHGTSASLPSTESAVDQGAPATHMGVTRPRARDRGRFYLGPFNTQGLSSVNGLPYAFLLSDIGKTSDRLFKTHNIGAANQFNVVQWSRRGASIGNVAFYYVDEAFCTQRRRADTTANRVHSWNAV